MRMSDVFSESDLVSRFPPHTVIGTPDFNRIAATNAMIDFFARQDPSCVDRYFKTPYVNHNTRAPDGLAPVHGLAQRATAWDGVHTIVRRALAEDDLVALHSVYSNLGGVKGQRVAFDLFRLHEGKIVEHWDALQDAVFPDECGLGQTGGPVDITDRGQEVANRTVATRFVDTVLVRGEAGQDGQFIDAGRYVEHSPPRHGGLTRVRGRFAAAPDERGARYLRYHRTIAEGNFVLVQGEGRIGETRVLVIYDLFRLESGKIAEHWDVLEAVAPQPEWASPHGPF